MIGSEDNAGAFVIDELDWVESAAHHFFHLSTEGFYQDIKHWLRSGQDEHFITDKVNWYHPHLVILCSPSFIDHK